MDEKILKDKVEQGYDTDVDLLLKMKKVLNRIGDFDDYYDQEEEIYSNPPDLGAE